MQVIWNTSIFRETIHEISSQEYVDKYFEEGSSTNIFDEKEEVKQAK